jgi:hypothetical protein
LLGFDATETQMLFVAIAALRHAGYDLTLMREVIRVDMPARYRGMTLPDGAALGTAAFSSQEMLNHVLEEELRHLEQKRLGRATTFSSGTARALEEEVDEARKFPHPSPNAPGSTGPA